MSRADDEKRSKDWLVDHAWTAADLRTSSSRLADLIADVRAETFEAAAKECDAFGKDETSYRLGRRIRALAKRLPSTPDAEASGAFKAANDILAGARKAAR